MTQLVIPNVEDQIKQGLQERARRHGRSLEEEVLEILRDAAGQHVPGQVPLGTLIAGYFRDCGFDSEIPEIHGDAPRPASFDE